MNVAVPGSQVMTHSSANRPSQSVVSVNLDSDRFRIVDLHRQVLNDTARVELRSRDGQATVLISKSELDALEQALAILSDTEGVRGVREQLGRLAALTAGPLSG
jgi:hypothetical protein